MNGADKKQEMKEKALVNLYKELTGANEVTARGVYMYMDDANDTPVAHDEVVLHSEERSERAR